MLPSFGVAANGQASPVHYSVRSQAAVTDPSRSLPDNAAIDHLLEQLAPW
jgi:hypothetical protein